MTQRLPVSAVVITLNEEKNILRCLRSLSWAEEVLVVDSGSTDGTVRLAQELGVTVLAHEWQGYGQQKNWAMKQVRNPWVFFLDADEEVSEELAQELRGVFAGSGLSETNGFRIPRKTRYLGKWIRHGGWYPNFQLRLARANSAVWTEPEVHEVLQVQGKVLSMSGELLHYTFANVGEQVETNIRFSRLGAKAARAKGERGALWKVLFKPIGKFIETYLWKLGFLDGFPGFVISINASHSLFMKYVELFLEENFSRR